MKLLYINPVSYKWYIGKAKNKHDICISQGRHIRDKSEPVSEMRVSVSAFVLPSFQLTKLSFVCITLKVQVPLCMFLNLCNDCRLSQYWLLYIFSKISEMAENNFMKQGPF
jgi:hypothetical protein